MTKLFMVLRRRYLTFWWLALLCAPGLTSRLAYAELQADGEQRSKIEGSQNSAAVQILDLHSVVDASLTRDDAERNAFLFSYINRFSFPQAYERIWQSADVQGCADAECRLAVRAKAMLRDYVHGRWNLHWRHFTTDPYLAAFLASETKHSLKSVLLLLRGLRVHTFSAAFSIEHYGFQRVEAHDKDVVPERTDEDGRQFRSVQNQPGSLYARARFIFLHALATAAEETNARGSELDFQTQRLIAENFNYYLDPYVDPVKVSSSPFMKGVRVASLAASAAVLAYLGPLLWGVCHVTVPLQSILTKAGTETFEYGLRRMDKNYAKARRITGRQERH